MQKSSRHEPENMGWYQWTFAGAEGTPNQVKPQCLGLCTLWLCQHSY